MNANTSPPPPPADAPKPANPEPTSPPVDPERGVKSGPEQGHSEHPKQ